MTLPTSGSVSSSQPLRYVDFETGDFSQVTSQYGMSGRINGGGDPASTPVIVSDVVHNGRYAAKLPTPNPAVYQSSNIDLWSWTPSDYPPLYYSFWVYVQAGYHTGYGANNWQQLTEWNSPAPYYGGRHIDVSFGDTYSGQYNQVYLNFFGVTWGGPDVNSGVSIPTGQWVHFVIYFKNSLNSDGQILVYMNDNLIIQYNGRTQFDTTSGNTSIQWSFANYCGTSTPPHTFWYDDVWVDYVPH